MTRGLSLPWPVLIATIGAALAVLGLILGASIVSAQQATVVGGNWTFDKDSTGNVVEITVTGFSGNIGASDISVAFDSKVLKITACDEGDLGGACNQNAPAGPVQVAGFDAKGITTPAVIAELTFDCIGAAGSSSALTITVTELVDVVITDDTAEDPKSIDHTIQNGTVTCAAVATPVPSPVAPPPTGGLPPVESSGSSTGWIIALAAALGAAGFGVTIFGARSLRKRN